MFPSLFSILFKEYCISSYLCQCQTWRMLISFCLWNGTHFPRVSFPSHLFTLLHAFVKSIQIITIFNSGLKIDQWSLHLPWSLKHFSRIIELSWDDFLEIVATPRLCGWTDIAVQSGVVDHIKKKSLDEFSTLGLQDVHLVIHLAKLVACDNLLIKLHCAFMNSGCPWNSSKLLIHPVLFN